MRLDQRAAGRFHEITSAPPDQLTARGESTPPSPDVKKTVDAFAGHWVLTGTEMEPGAKAPVSVKANVDCRLAVLGAA
jgi:hypothetical protein